MVHDAQDLKLRLDAFVFDEPEAALPFSARLARENGWSSEYTDRVIEEYRRFVLLAMLSDQPMTPSDAVDQVWHLHLTFSESYWHGLCGNTIGRPLHHRPTRGGPAEGRKYRGQYETTLASYLALLGREPPVDIWPPVERRFGPARFVRVDASSHWIVPEPAWWWRRLILGAGAHRPRALGLLLACAAALAGCATTTLPSPLELPGPEFLAFFAVSWVVCLALASAWKQQLLQRPAGALGALPELDPYQVACLVGGADRVVEAAVTHLVASNVVAFDEVGGGLTRVGPLGVGAHAVERAVYEAIPTASELTPTGAKWAAALEVSKIEARLTELELVRTQRFREPLLLALVVPAIGVVKTVVGLSRDRPVGILVALCALSSWTAFKLFGASYGRTPRGEAILDQLTQRHESLRTQETDPGAVALETLPLSVALFGLSTLATPELDRVHQVFGGTKGQAGLGGGGGGGGDVGGDAAGGDVGGDAGGGDGGGGCGGCGG